jgi:hypothetical protein
VDVIFIALLVVLTCTALSVRLLGDAGIGWHIRNGQQILASHAVPRVDSFSSTMQGKPWFAWEWLYDVIAGILDAWAGLNGVVWFTAVVIAGVFTGTFRLLLRRGTNVFVALVLFLLAASASMIHALARPHVVSWLFTMLWFWILDSGEPDSSETGAVADSSVRQMRRLWLLPLLMVVWANVHGGFLVGFVLLGIYWVSAVWCAVRVKEDPFGEFLAKLWWWGRVRKLTVVSVVAGAASLVNPYGWKLHAHIYGYLANRFLMDHITEFQSPNFHGLAQKCFALLALATMVALAARGRELRVSQGLVVLFALYSGLYASRNIPVSSLLLAMVIGPLLTEGVESLGAGNIWVRRLGFRLAAFARRMTALESGLRGHLWAVAAAGLIFWIALHGGRVGPNQVMDAHFDGKRFPVAAVEFLERKTADEARGSVTVPDDWGGYVIYRLYPKTLVTIDDRHDLYGEEFLKLYMKMVHVEPGWDEFLRKYDAHCVLVPKGSALANILKLTPEWKTIYGDDVAVIFERGPGPNIP